MKLPDWLKSHRRRFREETNRRIQADLARRAWAGELATDYLPPDELWRNPPPKETRRA